MKDALERLAQRVLGYSGALRFFKQTTLADEALESAGSLRALATGEWVSVEGEAPDVDYDGHWIEVDWPGKDGEWHRLGELLAKYKGKHIRVDIRVVEVRNDG